MSDNKARITVKVKPRASREQLEGWKEGALVARLTSPPVEGAANESLVRLLSKKTGVPRSRIRIVQGERSRSKVLQFDGISLDELRGRLK